jgi:hypothetical protein
MDTTTVLEIIKMLDAQIRMNSDIISTDSTLRSEDVEGIANESWGLEKFRDYLQEYIELQVSAMENSTAE